jgi:hypothetical protein
MGEAGFREECADYINCDLCHRYAPTQWCERCCIDYCKACETTHGEVHLETLQAEEFERGA